MKPRATGVPARRGASPAPIARPPYEARMLKRALAVLDRFAERDEWAFMDLCAAVGLHKSTAFRIVTTLEGGGYIEKRRATGRYRPGRKWARLEQVLLAAEPLRWAALGPLQDVARQTEETAHIGVLYEGESVTVQLVEGSHSLRMHSAVGRRAPAHASAMGKVFLAHLEDAELDEFVARFGLRARTRRTFTDPARLRAHLRTARQRGFTVDDEELEAGLRCVSVPVAEAGARPFAAVSISGPAWRLSPSRDEAIAKVLRETARRIVDMFGRFRTRA